MTSKIDPKTMTIGASGAVLELFGDSLDVLGCLGVVLGRLGCVLECLGVSWRRLGRVLGCLGGISGAFWEGFGEGGREGSWRVLGRISRFPGRVPNVYKPKSCPKI